MTTSTIPPRSDSTTRAQHHGASPVGQVLRSVAARPSAGVLALLVVICVVTTVVSPTFVTFTNLSNVANQMTFVLLVAAGMTVVLITGGIDLSVGSVMGLSGGVSAFLLLSGVPVGGALVLGVVAGAVLGLVNGLLITRLGLPDFIATLAMLGIARGLLFLWTNGVPFINFMTPEYATLSGLERPFGAVTVPIIIGVVVCILLTIILRTTAFGRHLYGVGSNRDAARLSGVRVDRVRVLAYVISGLLAGLAGVLLAGQNRSVAPTLGLGFEIQAIAAAVIGGAALSGGRGRVFGAILGALTLTIAANAINLAGVSSTWQQVVTGSILLLAVVLDRVNALARRRSARRSASLAAAPPPQSA